MSERETHGFERVLADIRFVTQVKPDAEELFRIALRWTPEERAFLRAAIEFGEAMDRG